MNNEYPIYFMRENHTFKKLHADISVAVEEIDHELSQGWAYATLCTKRPGATTYHFRDVRRPVALEGARDWLRKEWAEREAGNPASVVAPTASDAGTIDTPEFRDMLARVWNSSTIGLRDERAKPLVAHINKHVAAAVEKVREELEEAHSRALTRTEMESRNAGRAEADEAAKLRSTAGVGEAVTPEMEDAFTAQIPTFTRDEVDHPNDTGRIKWSMLDHDAALLAKCITAAIAARPVAATAPVSAAPTAGDDEEAMFESEMRRHYGDEHFNKHIDNIDGLIWGSASLNGAWIGWQAGRATLPPSAGAPVSGAEQARVSTTDYHRGYQAGIEMGKALAADEAAPADGQELPALPPSDNAGDYVHDVQVYTVDETTQYGRACFNAGFLLAMHQPRGAKVAEACAASVAAAMGEPEGTSLEEMCAKLANSRKPIAWRAWPERDSGDITTSRATTELWRKNGVPFRALAYINDVSAKQAGKEAK